MRLLRFVQHPHQAGRNGPAGHPGRGETLLAVGAARIAKGFGAGGDGFGAGRIGIGEGRNCRGDGRRGGHCGRRRGGRKRQGGQKPARVVAQLAVLKNECDHLVIDRNALVQLLGVGIQQPRRLGVRVSDAQVGGGNVCPGPLQASLHGQLGGLSGEVGLRPRCQRQQRHEQQPQEPPRGQGGPAVEGGEGRVTQYGAGVISWCSQGSGIGVPKGHAFGEVTKGEQRRRST